MQRLVREPINACSRYPDPELSQVENRYPVKGSSNSNKILWSKGQTSTSMRGIIAQGERIYIISSDGLSKCSECLQASTRLERID